MSFQCVRLVFNNSGQTRGTDHAHFFWVIILQHNLFLRLVQQADQNMTLTFQLLACQIGAESIENGLPMQMKSLQAHRTDHDPFSGVIILQRFCFFKF